MNTVKLRVIKKVCLMERKKHSLSLEKYCDIPLRIYILNTKAFSRQPSHYTVFCLSGCLSFYFFNHFRRILEERTGIFKQIDIFIYIRRTELTHIYLRKNFGFFCKMFL